MSPTKEQRSQWSRMGFIFAASGSAIGLGNIVFFPANAYRYGGGAFYLPYLVALVSVGIPLLILELGLGHQERKAFPAALRQVAGPRGEFLGWWALANTTFITLYYVAILGCVVGTFLGALGPPPEGLKHALAYVDGVHSLRPATPVPIHPPGRAGPRAGRHR